MVLNTEWAQVEVIDLINDGSGLAFGIIGGRSTGVVVKTILPGGVADRDGRLQSGDHILQIGDVNLRGLGSEQVASVLRQCGVHVRMVVARPVESANADFQVLGSQAPIVPTKILGDPIELEKHLLENGSVGTCGPLPPIPYVPLVFGGAQNSISDMVDVVRNPLPIGKIPKTCLVPRSSLVGTPSTTNLESPETETFTIELKKDDLGLGITVAGYVCEKEEISGIFVKSISKGSAADATRNIKINDRIIEVNDTSVIGYTNHQAVEFLKHTGQLVKIKFERYLRGPKFEQLQQAIKANELRPPSPSSPTITSLPKIPLSLVQMNNLVIEADGESRTSIDFDSGVLYEANSLVDEEKEIVIDGRKSVQFNMANHDSIYEKWIGRVENSIQIIIAQMHKTENSGLGISLEGTVDVEDGIEVRPHHYIRNILPDGPVGINGVLRSGDELLEVNGIQLFGMNHLEVVSILKHLPASVCIVCARYAVPIRIIDTSQHPDAFKARKILAGSLQNIIQTTEPCHLVKAKSESSLASSGGSNGGALTLSKSRSLELIAGLPMWCDEVTVVELNKGDHGLGFSILDYQDPLNPQETVIVIRSLVPGGVAQTDGRLIPGDRLLAVNDINVARANLDTAVQVLKGAPKGLVRIAVAKPLNSGDAVSHTSQETEEDQTCLEEFQECIEEFQDDLIAVPIFLEDDRSFNNSPSISQVEDFGQKNFRFQNHVIKTDFFDNGYLNIKELKRDSTGDSDIDISFQSTNDNCLDGKTDGCDTKIQLILTNQCKVNSVTQSEKISSGRDDYDTCLEESLSEDNTTKVEKIDFLDETTPTNSKVDLTCCRTSAKNSVPSFSEPCLPTDPFANSQQICLQTKLDDLKSYDNQLCEGDEFFLVEYLSPNVCKSVSEPNVLDNPDMPKKLTFKLREYYNDYENCLDSYREVTVYEKIYGEMRDSQIFNEIFLPYKSRSAPDIMDRSFVTLTYDPGPDCYRRKSAFAAGYSNNDSDMTIIRHNLEQDFITMKDNQGNVLHNRWGSTHIVKVYREPDRGLGISIVGGKVDVQPSEQQTEALTGIFVKNVTPGTAAAKTEQFKTGDRILEVSGIDLREATHDKAVEAIRGAPNPVVFLVQSLIPWENAEEDNNFRDENEEEKSRFSPPNTPPPYNSENNLTQNDGNETKTNESSRKNSEIIEISPDIDHQKPSTLDNEEENEEEEEEEEENVTELEGRTVSAGGHQIDRASAANIKRSKDEVAADNEKEDEFGYTTNKVKKKYGNLGHNILMVQLERAAGGLGLSLAGHRDRNCMAVFVCGLNPNGAAYKTGSIQIGDEILEVNGVVLHGRCHLNASAIIKSLTGPIFKVIVLRRKAAIDDIAVKPITQFPVSLAEETSEEHFKNTYPNVRTVAIKKQSGQSLGIMIIEGKHADVGQGIFISDIQEGSSAEKAGLEIGEMILAVNKDSLVGSNYDTAANLLKRTEGLVTLIVSKPGKKDQSHALTPTPSAAQANNATDGKLLKTPTTPSRPATPVPEPPADPLTCLIVPGRETVIEVNTNNESLGISFIGGKDTVINNAIVVTDVYKNGAAEKDGRLQAGDQILDVNGISLRDSTNTTASQALRQTLPKMKITIFRPTNLEYTPLEVDLVKKPGKGLGLSITGRKSRKGVYVADIIPGSCAELDGKIAKGDILVSVNGQNLEEATSEEAGAILKTAMGRVSLKLHRYKTSTINQ
ncbi:hypothetical protein ABEB36_002361 [Hypothenemus hampei]|uniref:PDZ domain-containing protein n=1 Tax=Hypothenemus hampei TaxID=57062 RepID=A0ABD1F5I6_HYPHA